MKINKKGFTLIELLIVIAVLGIVLSVGAYFTIKSIENSRKVAYETTLKGVYSSAVTYANEFFEDTDWVDTGGDTEYSCVNAWWLVNKGFLNKNNFTDSNETNKFKKSDIVVLYRNKSDKVINSQELNANITNCINTLTPEIELTPTYNTVTVKGTCKIKEDIQNDVSYRFCRDNSECQETDNNNYTFTGLTNGNNYTFSLVCLSDEYGNSNPTEGNIDTIKINDPSINCNENTVQVNFNNNNSNNLTKEVSVNRNNVTYNSNNIMIKDRFEDFSSIQSLAFNISNVSDSNVSDSNVTFTAKVKADNTDANKKEISKTCSKVKTDVEKPYFIASDNIASDNWHKDNFNLKITNSVSNPTAVIYYKNANDSTWTTYSSEINVTGTSTYIAKACINNNNNCSGETTYIAKIDKDAPTISYTATHGTTQLIPELKMQTNPVTLLSSYAEQNVSNLAWLNYSVQFNIDISDDKSSLYNYDTYYKIDGTKYKKSDSNSYWSKNVEVTFNGEHNIEINACDNAGNCNSKTIYFKIDQTVPVIEYTGIVSANHYMFKCTSGLSGIHRFFGSDSKGNGVNSQRINGPNIFSQNISNNGNGYWFESSGDIYLTCSSNAIKFMTGDQTGYTPNDVVRILTDATFSLHSKSSGTYYKWDCPQYGVSGHKSLYTSSGSNPYPEHCGNKQTISYSSGCGNDYTYLNDKLCYSYNTYVPK